MALARPAAGSQSAADVLKQALADFQADLPAEERKQLHSQTVEETLSFVASLNDKSSKRRSRRIAARLEPFLRGIQMFTTSVNPIFQGASEIAQLIWHSVRFSLLVACNFTEYFMKLTDLVSDVATKYANFQEYASLLGTSAPLLDALCLYHVSVIKLWQRGVGDVRRSGFAQIPRSMLKSFDQTF